MCMLFSQFINSFIYKYTIHIKGLLDTRFFCLFVFVFMSEFTIIEKTSAQPRMYIVWWRWEKRCGWPLIPKKQHQKDALLLSESHHLKPDLHDSILICDTLVSKHKLQVPSWPIQATVTGFLQVKKKKKSTFELITVSKQETNALWKRQAEFPLDL